MGRRWWLVLLMCASVGAQQVDRGDPEAVAAAYLAALEAGEFAAAIELVGEERLRAELTAVLNQLADEVPVDDYTVAAMLLREAERPQDAVFRLLLLPGFLVDDGERAMRDEATNQDELRLFVDTPLQHRALLVMVRVDGEWSVNLRSMHQDRYGAEGGLWLEWLDSWADSADRQAEEEPPRRRALRRASRARSALGGVLYGLLEYAGDHGGRLPPATTWRDALVGYPQDAGIPHADTEAADEPLAVAFNAEAGGLLLPDDPDELRLLPLVTLVPGEQANQVFYLAEFEEVAVVLPDLQYVPDEDEGTRAVELETRAVGLAVGQLLRRGVDEPLDEWLAARAEALAAERGVKERLVLLFEGAIAYAAEHDGRLPGAATWCDDLAPHLPETAADGRPVLISPGTIDAECSFAINAAYAGGDLNQIGWRKPKWLFTETAGCARNTAVEDDAPAAAVRWLATSLAYRPVLGAWLVSLRGEAYWRPVSATRFHPAPMLGGPQTAVPGMW